MYQTTGNRKREGRTLGHIGNIYCQNRAFEKAISYLRQAIVLCDRTHPSTAGFYRGILAVIYAEQAQFKEALTLLTKGEPQVTVSPFIYAKFLCAKAKVLQLNNQPEQAAQTIQQAEALNTQPNTELHTHINQTKRWLNTYTQKR